MTGGSEFSRWMKTWLLNIARCCAKIVSSLMADSCSFGETTLPEKYALRSASRVVSTPHFLQSSSVFLNCASVGFLRNTWPICKITHQPVAHAHRHRAVAQTGRAGDRFRLIGGLLAQAFLHLQAGGAGAVFSGKQRAKGVLIALAVMGQLPGFDRLQRDRQAGQVAEGALVIAIDAGVGQRLHQGAVALAVFGRRRGGIAVGLRP